MEKAQGRGNAKWVVLATLVLVCLQLQAAEGVQHQVGGTPGWTLPSRANVNYTTWASGQHFSVGDTLYFNYSAEYHNVLQVTKAKYDTCDTTSPIMTKTDGATTIALNAAGTTYYICGFPTHCDQGQKVAVTVEASASSSTPASRITATAPVFAALYLIALLL